MRGLIPVSTPEDFRDSPKRMYIPRITAGREAATDRTRSKLGAVMLRKLMGVCFCLIVLPLIIASAAYSPQQDRVDFRKDIYPILQQACHRCHGTSKAMGELRLDSKQAAMRGGISGRIIISGNSKESRFLQRVLGLGGEARMPLGGDPLTDRQIDLLRHWIDQGAVWPDDSPPPNKAEEHWSLVAPVRPATSAVSNKSWVRNPIDNFTVAKMEQQGLAPSPEASKTTLVRRLSLDLTGLPPTLEDVDRFLADRDPNAYEKLVERLLASPHYGERWGRHWLDVARYADTNGFEKDLPRSIWPYRDWVISAFNRDLPFDQFTIEQLAGDLLPNPGLDQRVATGFLRNSMLNQEGGVDPEQFRVEGIIDRVDTIGKAFLGLTINCAQCHTHKYDPIQQQEYYRFYAFLNSDDEPEIEVPDERLKEKRADILAKVERIEDDLIAKDHDLAKRSAEWEEQAKRDKDQWVVLEDTSIFAAFGTKFDRLEDHSYIAKGDNSTGNNYIIRAKTNLKGITGLRLELLTDPNLPRMGPGRANDGSLFLSEFSIEAAREATPDVVEKVGLSNATADFSHPEFPVTNAIDGDPKTAWSIDAGPGRRNQDRKAVFEMKTPVGFDGGTILTIQLAQKQDETISLQGGKPNLGRLRLSITTVEAPRADPLPARVRQLISMDPSRRTSEQQREIFSYYRTTDLRFTNANKAIDELMRQWPYGPTTLALAPRKIMRETRIFRGGDWRKAGDLVTPSVPAALHSLPSDAPANRLGLAKWIVDRRNPLTARVIVNRIWQQYFGQGLVTTPEDFGSRGERPSHPELLDWLSTLR